VINFFRNLFAGGNKQPHNKAHAQESPQRRPRPETKRDIFRVGDVIAGKYRIQRKIGEGGFGVVYLAYRLQINEVCALKTFRDELLVDAAAREAYKKEAFLWVNLEEHPFILAARWVEEVSGRLFVEMDYVVPDAAGRVSLADHLARAASHLDADQTLKWAVQFCLGMEHAQARGFKCHRDIKPANILITQDGTLKISDFGLAVAAETAWQGTGGRIGSLVSRGPEGSFGLSLMQTEGKARCGTPGYMAPEVYRGEGSDIRSDIYSFGLVLWQMAMGSHVPPFVVPYRGNMEGYLRENYDRQMSGRVPRVDGFLMPIIERCLRPNPTERYSSFAELRAELEPILERKTGKKFEVPQVGEKTAVFWNNKGGSLAALGRHAEAISCYDQALAIDQRNAQAWNNKGNALTALGRFAEAIGCFDQALAINPRYGSAWQNKGAVLDALGRHAEAIGCFDQALAIDPRDAQACNNKGNALTALGRREEAVSCYDQALVIDPRYTGAWYNKGSALDDSGRHEEAISCYDQALAIDPRDAKVWSNKGSALDDSGRYAEAISCFDQALAIGPRDAKAWYNKGNALYSLGRRAEAIGCYDQALAIDPRYARAWNNKGVVLADLGRHEEAVSCYDQAMAIDPRDEGAWKNKGLALANLGRHAQAINLASPPQVEANANDLIITALGYFDGTCFNFTNEKAYGAMLLKRKQLEAAVQAGKSLSVEEKKEHVMLRFLLGSPNGGPDGEPIIKLGKLNLEDLKNIHAIGEFTFGDIKAVLSRYGASHDGIIRFFDGIRSGEITIEDAKQYLQECLRESESHNA
jgi:tetratricopeptide (TPR) repeat protein